VPQGKVLVDQALVDTLLKDKMIVDNAQMQHLMLQAFPPEETLHQLLRQGHWFLGMDFNLRHDSGENNTGLLSVIDQEKRLRWDVRLNGGYNLIDYLAIGGEIGFSYDDQDKTFTADDVTYELKRFNYGISIGPLLRVILPLGSQQIFYLYADTIFRFAIGEEIVDVATASEREKQLSTTYIWSLGIEPGLLAFVAEGFALQVGIRLLGVKAQLNDTTTNRTEASNSSEVDVNFDIDILSLKLGLVYYF
jgi:hypothetical protein